MAKTSMGERLTKVELEVDRLTDAVEASLEARDTAREVKLLVEQKMLAMVEEDHRTLRGQNGNDGLVSKVNKLTDAIAGLRTIALWACLGFASFFAALLWALITHRIAVEQVVSTALP